MKILLNIALILELLVYMKSLHAQVPPANAASGPWMMYQGSRKHTGVQLMKADLSQGRIVKWLFGVPNVWIYSSPAIVDVNNNGIPDVIFGAGNTLYALRGDNGNVISTFITNGDIYASPAVGDLNSDGFLDIVIGSRDSLVYAISGQNGSLLWSYNTFAPIISSAVIVNDLNNNGSPDVVVGSGHGFFQNTPFKVFALDGSNGSLIWSFQTNWYISSSPASADVNGDGIEDIFLAGGDGIAYALNGVNGSILWTYTVGVDMQSSPAIWDVNNDGVLDVVISSSNHNIYILKATNGQLIWQYSTNNEIWGSPAICALRPNLINSSVIVSSFDNNVYNLDGNSGNPFWIHTLSNHQDFPSGIRVADIDPNLGNEIIVDIYDSIYVLSSSGSVLWADNPINSIITNLSIGDVDNDGCSEIVVSGYQRIAVIDAPGNNCGFTSCGNLSNFSETSYKYIKEGVIFKEKIAYEVFNIQGSLIMKGFGNEVKINKKGIYFIKTKNEIIKFVRN